MGGCLCQALTLCLLNHVEVLSGAVQGQLEALKGWEKTSRTWLFIKPLGFHHILKYFNTQMTNTDTPMPLLPALSVKKLVVKTLLPSAVGIMSVLPLYVSMAPCRGGGWGSLCRAGIELHSPGTKFCS